MSHARTRDEHEFDDRNRGNPARRRRDLVLSVLDANGCSARGRGHRARISGQYAWAGEQFASHGFAAHALDLRGRGKSDGERFFVQQFEDYVSDVDALVRNVRERRPALPLFLLGHSAGGVVACLYALEHQADLAGLVCESFAFQVPRA